MVKLKINITLLFILISQINYAQAGGFEFYRKINGVKDDWHKLVIPVETYKNIRADFEDLRIYKIGETDTLEVPYLITRLEDKVTVEEVEFDLINKSKNDKGFFYTFQMPKQVKFNRIEFDFVETDFDWLITVEGSNNQLEWYVLAEKERILAINEPAASYKYTSVNLPSSLYKFVRVNVNAKKQPNLVSAKVSFNKIIPGEYYEYNNINQKTGYFKKDRTTVIEIDLLNKVPVSYLKITPKSNLDFLRRVRIELLLDSVMTKKGIVYNYTTIYLGSITSLASNEFKFNDVTGSKLIITIYDYDNIPLEYNTVIVKGNMCELTARFLGEGDYYLAYGNSKINKPDYDLINFTDKIPEKISRLSLGEVLTKENDLRIRPLFVNHLWLWGIIVIVVIVLGWFAIKMIKAKDSDQAGQNA